MVGNKEFRIHNYPSPNLRFIRGKWVVEVSIPSSIRFLFGSGAVRARRKSTKTTDRALAEARMPAILDLKTIPHVIRTITKNIGLAMSGRIL